MSASGIHVHVHICAHVHIPTWRHTHAHTSHAQGHTPIWTYPTCATRAYHLLTYGDLYSYVYVGVLQQQIEHCVCKKRRGKCFALSFVVQGIPVAAL